ncbi:alanine--tRNA ligase [Thermobispora bispora]|uniref:Alanine--tRNA ligase n=1 Tax=Thermobispora bispora (strain ATCC 19993 / DSM 43833 / CBS 139.67 / JCM 10125 / KCTC 9307 / NBRC 14880 / R51) TaxID=469371 RepID=D6Y2B0_THEBD|nr:alanine--tRNA ligase [Thermobispora bispora]ADG88759.1 alanyl-tRNA synthetase [Thermobispora bispora DSM 43833]MBO2473342.1 alanine--tRNA ligase [Actinomycetales bacterium]MBX6166178.1 alanine--tRNA ligase [Thermobispora bispora]MDI9580931.1 alanine--tRNA ligase [Thermobispora sp.]
MESAEIARRFLRFFEENGHTVVPSASLVAEDPTLLLVNAGMVPFKPYFLGQQKPPFRRATSLQKCVRTLDIDEVGKTPRHASFFQMLGNFSFGDYFKEGAIPFAWELLTRPVSEGGFGFPEDRLWVTVYLDDDEAQEIWRKVGVPAERIQRRGLADNYWHMGVPGPGGPCSEIYYDRGPQYGREGGPIADENRYLEVWNLVFMQEQLSAVRSKTDFDVAGPLPAKNIDTGMGLERMAAILQGVDNIYEIDTTSKIIKRAAELTETRYGRDERSDICLRVVADHMRAGVMLVGDGVLPSNEGRGYVLRRMLRRTIRNLRLLGAGEERYMRELTATTIEAMSGLYPELKTEEARIHTVIEAEEASFLGTLRTGTAIFDAAVAETKRKGGTVLSGEQAFQLHDTYGFPIDLTLEMAAEQGLKVDEEGFRRLMQEQRERAKADAKAKKTGHADISVFSGILEKAGKIDFVGYDRTTAEATVVGLIVNGVSVPAAGEGTSLEIVLDRTPFYAEGGGQLADQGVIRTSGAEIEVLDVQSPIDGLIVHRGKVRSGEVLVGDQAHAEIDVERRRAISRSHTATHMVHRGFRNALGESAAQAGSENSPGRFRFDFTSAGAVPPSVLRDVEDEVNAVLINDLPVRAFYTSQAEARAMGALALFGEKYGDEVRVVEVGDYSRELCGGTHVATSGQLGLIKILGESSVGAGVRRVEALVGLDAFRFLAKESVLVSQLSEQLKARREELPERIEGIVSRLRAAEKELERLRSAQVLAVAGELAAGARDVHGVSLVTHRAPDGTTADDLRKLALDVRGRFPADRAAVVVVAGVPANRPVVVVAANEAARERGVKAGQLVGVAAKALGGGGGGRDDVAQGGGSRPEAIEDALRAVEAAVASAQS